MPHVQDEDLLAQHYPYLRGGRDIYSCADEHKVGDLLSGTCRLDDACRQGSSLDWGGIPPGPLQLRSRQ